MTRILYLDSSSEENKKNRKSYEKLKEELIKKKKILKERNKAYKKIEYKEDYEIKEGEYEIIFRDEDFERKMYFKKTDTVSEIYKALFSKENKKKLIYEDNKLNKYLTIEESGFYEGKNYIGIEKENKEKILIKIFYKENNKTKEIEVESNKKIKQIKKELLKNKEKDFLVIYKGNLVTEELLIGEVVKDEERIDIIEIDEVTLK